MERALGVLVLALTLVMAGCKKSEGDAASGKPPAGGKGGGGRAKGGVGLSFPVDTINTEVKKVEYVITAPGTLDAFERVQVTARVAGAVDKVGFTEGQQVKKGDLLAVIDAARYRVAVNSAQAAVAKAEASAKDVEAQITRREGASEKNPGLIPGEELATYRTKGLTAKADTAVAVEALRSAQLNLRDASIRAPMDGIIQTRTVETGQFVQAGYVMATLLRNDPMLLRFQVLPQEAPLIKPGTMAQFKLRESQRTFSAKITLVSGSADESTRLVNVTGEVVDNTHKFWLRPGSFCDVTLEMGSSRDAVVIPILATRPSDHGTLAYVVEGDTAHERVLQIGMHTSDGWIEVKTGLKAGEKLVLRGAEPLSEGSKVKVTEVAPPPGPALPGSAAAAAAASGSAAAAADASGAPPAPPPGTPLAPAADAATRRARPAGSARGQAP
jgi:RND family efflux transporter MFP subunit